MPVVFGKETKSGVSPKHNAGFGWLTRNASKIVSMRVSTLRKGWTTKIDASAVDVDGKRAGDEIGRGFAAEARDGRIFYHAFDSMTDLADAINPISALRGKPIEIGEVYGTGREWTSKVPCLPKR